MSQPTVPESHQDLIDTPLTAVLTTVNPDGQPQSTAVWYLEADGVLQTSLTTTRQKYKNLARNPMATLFVMDPANPFKTLEIRATVELSPDPEKSLLSLFAERYSTPVEMLDNPADTRVIVTFRPTRIVANG